MDRYSVYAKVDDDGRVIDLDGGVTQPANLDGWIQIDEGAGERYALCQNHYMDGPLRDEREICRYKLQEGKIIRRTREEMDADWMEPIQEQTIQEQLKELKEQNEMLTECILELSEILYN